MIYAFFERLLDPYQPYDDTRPPPDALAAFYAHFLWPSRWFVAATVVSGLAIAVMDALLIQYAGRIVDILTETAPENLWAEHGDTLLTMCVVAFLLRPLVITVDRIAMGQGFYPGMGALIRWRTHRHILRQSVSFFNDDFAGRIANKQIQLAPAFNDTVFQVIDAVWYALVYVVAAAIIFGDIDTRLLIPLGVWLALYIATAMFFIPRIASAGKDVAEARSRLAGRIVDSYTNIQTVKLFAHAAREEAYARESMEHMRWEFARQTRLFTSLTITLTLVNTFLIGGTLGYAVWLWSEAGLTVGAVAAAAALVLRLQAMTDWIMWTLSMLFQQIGVVMEGMETVSQPLRLQDNPAARPIAPVTGHVRFDNVTHHYGRSQPTSPAGAPTGAGVSRIALDIKPGEKVGLVGRSGAGKSTLVNLMLRFFDPEQGRVLIDGADIRDVTQESLRGQIGMVTQDTSLLHRSILDNILYGAPDASRAEAERAARHVAAHAFIMDLVDRDGRHGYDAHVGERGVKLSGGQRQRIALARVVLKNAPILVLDEATSALDSEVEAAILESLEDLMVGKTVIAIAHRLSTIAAMDRIVVLDAGQIVEEGPHEALRASGGLYASLWARQSGGFLAIDAPASAR